jgi:two-component system cell cycle sensor histidine kinase/response regulator CckA
MKDFIRLLLIEDDEQDAELIRMALEEGDFELSWRRVESEAELRLELAKSPWDLIISDFAMPGFDGLNAFRIVQELRLDIPFIYVSGALGEERAVAAMRAGARDYILKGNLSRLAVAVRRELSASKIKQSERRLEANSRQEQRRLEIAVEASGAGIFEWRQGDLAPHISFRLREILGITEDQIPALVEAAFWAEERLHPEDRPAEVAAFRSFLAGETERLSLDARVKHTSGTWIDVAAFAKAVHRDKNGQATHVIGVLMDVTDRRLLEEQLRHAQKMDAIGRLAGGVAHDFNNLLTAILSFTRFAMKAVEPDSRPYQDMEEVLKAGKRAEALTGQLLAFSRRKPISPQQVDVNDLITNLEKMLARLVGESIRLETHLDPKIGSIRMDPGSLEQVIVNLAVNARDAMPKGGRLCIQTTNVVYDEEATNGEPHQLPKGRCVEIRVSDEGTGMDDGTLQRIFEPFFTTKDVGSGTGLGLATCYGIVQQAGGSISVESQLGEGSTFRVTLPTTIEGTRALDSEPPSQRVRGRETVLVVEDEEPLRRLTVRTLAELGYRVIQAKNGADALSSYGAVATEIDLLVTDVIMPEVGGPTLAKRLLERNPKLRVLFVSGYAPAKMENDGLLDLGVTLLEKPFTPEQLASYVRKVLSAPEPRKN